MDAAPAETPSAPPLSLRARGAVRVRFARAGQRTVRADAFESAGYRVRFPKPDGAQCEAVLINTGGGMTGGDRLDIAIAAEAHTDAAVTSQAAEKIYRAAGTAPAEVHARLELGAGARLAWLPQEAILFAGALLRRSLAVEMAADASFLGCESLYFGRSAMGERLETAGWRERWRIRRAGRLVLAEDVRLEGAVDAALARPAVAAGAQAVATLVLVAPDAEARLEPLRALLAEAACEAGASAFDGLLLARLLGQDAAALRRDLVRLVAHLAGRPVPRSWQS